jgi:hypothetical protein
LFLETLLKFRALEKGLGVLIFGIFDKKYEEAL